MSNNAAQDLPNIDSLTDFIYIDQERTRNILAQFINKGVLTAFKEEFTETDSSTGEIGFQKWAIGKRSGTQQDSKKYAREFDVSPSLPLSLLDHLSEQGFIKDKVADAKVGNIVHISGEYRIFDISLIDKALPILQFLQDEKEDIPPADVLSQFMQLFPKSLQIDIRDESGKLYWLPLKKESMRITPEDILLSNGVTNRDRWHVVGILENKPASESRKGIQPFKFRDKKTQLLEINSTIKELIGRNDESYSITPILIFRKITK